MVKVSGVRSGAKGEREQRCRSKMQTVEMMQMFHSSLRNLIDHSEVRMEKMNWMSLKSRVSIAKVLISETINILRKYFMKVLFY